MQRGVRLTIRQATWAGLPVLSWLDADLGKHTFILEMFEDVTDGLGVIHIRGTSYLLKEHCVLTRWLILIQRCRVTECHFQ